MSDVEPKPGAFGGLCEQPAWRPDSMKNWLIRPALAGLLLAVGACDSPEADPDLVASVDDYALTVDQIVELLVDEEALAADANVVRSLADIWIDYTLLAETVDRDSTFSDLDLEPLVQRQLTQMMVFQLRDSVIQVDTFITESELEALYEAEAPEVELSARHIMLTYPPQASQAQRDSVRALLQDVRQRIASGTSFESLAQQISQDPATARQGGYLGYFGRGDMVAPFEEAALALEPGEVSDVVETPMGLHLIRLDDRRTQGFAESADAFRSSVQQQRVQQAESTFVVAVEARVNPEVVEGAVDVAREIAGNLEGGLSSRAGRRPLVEWTGGAVTVREVQTLLRSEPQQLGAQISAADDEGVELFLNDLARRELLVEEARSAGLQASRERVDSLVADAGAQLRDAARMLGLLDLDQAPGEPRELAIARAVEAALVDNLNGASQFVPLGLVGFQLRDRSSFAIRDTGIGQAIVRIGQVRANRALAPVDGGPDASTAPDTIGP